MSDPLRVLTLLHSHGCGGAEVHALHLMRGVVSTGGGDVAYAGHGDSWLGRETARAGIPVLSVPLRSTWDMLSLLRVARYARTHGCHVIHGHLTRGAFYARHAARLAHLPSVATAHSTNAWKHFAGADAVIAVSCAVRDSLAGHGIDPSTIRVVHLGIPDPPVDRGAERRRVRARLGLAEGDEAVVTVGRFHRDKGQDLSVEALSRLPRRFRLFLVGETGSGWQLEVAALARRLGVANRVTFLGHRDDVASILCGMDAYVAPSRREAFGLAIVEAMATGIPVVAARVGGVPEVVTDGSTGLLVPPEDPSAIALALLSLAGDPGEAARLGGGGRAAYRARFSREAMTAAVVEIYREVAHRT
jgi:glycosyltransferase involved in cell wall biosynthesis